MNNKIVSFLLSGFILVAASACNNAKTASNAPNSTDQNGQVPTAQNTQNTEDAQSEVRQKQLESDMRAKEQRNDPAVAPQNGEAPTVEDTNNAQDDAQSEVRKKQLESDIRAREQRNNAGGDPLVRAEGDLESEVRSKLEANIPNGQLTVDAKDGSVTVAGTVENQDQLNKIEPLAKEIKGVQTVLVKATVAPAQAQ